MTMKDLLQKLYYVFKNGETWQAFLEDMEKQEYSINTNQVSNSFSDYWLTIEYKQRRKAEVIRFMERQEQKRYEPPTYE